MQEAQMIAALRDRQQAGMDAFMARYTALMRYIIAPILPDAREQEECINDIALRVWDAIDSFDPKKGSFATWLTVLTRNTALNRARAKNRIREVPMEEMPLAAAPSPEDGLLQKEQSLHLQNLLQMLPYTEQMLLYRKYYYLQSTSQIAREFGMTERAVEGKLYRIKKKLKEKLGGDFHE